jgi:hypothetical protein
VFPVVADPADEGSHPPSDETLWSESWYFDFVSTDGSLGGYVRVGHYPNLGAVWYWACLVGDARPLVIVVDHDVVAPRDGRLELRHSGLWADHVCEEPLERWSLGLEAFAVGLDDPADAYGAMWGERVPFGFDLEWENDGEVFRYPPGLDRYEIPCRVHGEVLVGDETLAIDAVGQRDHSWGVRDWWSIGWCWTAFRLDDGSRWHAVVPEASPLSIGYVQPAHGAPEGVAYASVAPVLGERGIPDGATLSIGGTDFTVDPISWAPVLLRSPDGRIARFPRAAARFVGTDGTAGVGWIEFNQPQRSGADGEGSAVL